MMKMNIIERISGVIYVGFATMLLPVYSCAYGIAHMLRLRSRHEMPTIKEWVLDPFMD